MLVPDTPAVPTQVLDVRDLGAWMLSAAEAGTTGTYNAVGPVLSFARWVELSRQVGGHRGPALPSSPTGCSSKASREREEGLGRPRWAGLSASRERELLAALAK